MKDPQGNVMLMNCQICGELPELTVTAIEFLGEKTDIYQVGCDNCESWATGYTEGTVVERWNRYAMAEFLNK